MNRATTSGPILRSRSASSATGRVWLSRATTMASGTPFPIDSRQANAKAKVW